MRASMEVMYLMTRRKAIRLAPDEDQLLRRLYVRDNIPSDQYKQRPKAAARFLKEWNARSGRSDEWGDILHDIVTKRKSKRHNWPTLGDGHRRLADPAWETLSDSEWHVLEDVYAKLLKAHGDGSDNLLYDPALTAKMARMFCARTGRSVPSTTLVGLVFGKRKRGEWVVLQPKAAKAAGAGAWADMDEAEGGAAVGHLRRSRSAS